MKVVMVGARGRFASAVVPELTKRGVTVRALVRDRRKPVPGAHEVVVADLSVPASLPEAVAGADGVFHLGPAFAQDEAAMGVALVEAAKGAGVRKFVFSGVIHPSIAAMTNHAAKLPVEDALYASDLDFTVLQPARFMQNLEGPWQEAVEHGRLPMPYSVISRFCWVDHRDVAEVVAHAMTGDQLSRGTFELCAPGMADGLLLAELAAIELRRPIEPYEVPREEFAAAQLPQGPERDALLRMLAHYDRYGLPGGNPLALRTILHREPRSLAGYFHELAQR